MRTTFHTNTTVALQLPFTKEPILFRIGEEDGVAQVTDAGLEVEGRIYAWVRPPKQVPNTAGLLIVNDVGFALTSAEDLKELRLEWENFIHFNAPLYWVSANTSAVFVRVVQCR